MNNPKHSTRLSRSDFLKGVTGIIASAIAAFYAIPAVIYLVSPALRKQESDAWIPLGSLEKIPVGIPTPFSFTLTTVNGWEHTGTSYGVFAVRKDADNVIVLSNICTHLGCRVSWHPDSQEYISPCHNGHFDIAGNVTYGPPPRPLDEYQTKVEEGNLFILNPPYKRS
jgi:menaquinol-cytochrome c reductase iron-sulfur subunit